MVRQILAGIYYAIYLLLFPLVHLVARMSSRVGRQWHGRQYSSAELQRIAANRRRYHHGVIFFCSSAGEFEQAAPLINRLQSKNIYTHTFFFSRSGYDYAQARSFPYAYSLTPHDLPWLWRHVMDAINPQAVFVVRYELWPGFLLTAKKVAPLYLINASASQKGHRFCKRHLLDLFDRIYAVSDSDLPFFQQSTGRGRVRVVGDTKYDRVMERAQEHAGQIQDLNAKMRQTYADRRILVLGSCWHAEISLLLTAWQKMDPNLRHRLAVVLAPHNIDSKHLEQIETQIRSVHQDVIRFSRWMNDPRLAHGGTFLILDTMGKLAEVYGTAHCALIGGAFHHKIHNVLEPASHGLTICFGPRYHSQKEAILLVQQGLATVIENADDFVCWMLDQCQGQSHNGKAVLRQVHQLGGATDAILSELPGWSS